MTGFSPIAPPEYLRLLKAAGLLGNYHLILAHDVAARPEKYKNLFSTDDFIIMDNSLIELGNPVDIDTMRTACKVIKPTCIVLPDHLENAQKSLAATMTAGLEWVEAEVHLLARSGFMAVPQGRTLDAITDSYDQLKEWSKDAKIPINYWGIPKAFGERNKTRMTVIEYIAGEHVAPPKNIHLLGFSHNMKDDIECAMHSCVMGIDSAVPIRMGMEGIGCSIGITKHSPRGSYFEDAVNAAEVDKLVAANINYIRRLIR